MAAMAGLLGVRLEKAGHYELGDALRPLDADRIDEAWRIVLVSCGLSAVFALALMEVSGGSF
jgi:adenosylcobinamide-phosphate synthase